MKHQVRNRVRVRVKVSWTDVGDNRIHWEGIEEAPGEGEDPVRKKVVAKLKGQGEAFVSSGSGSSYGSVSLILS